MATRIQLRRDTAADWTTEDPTLHQGEAGFETDTNQMKLGDGTTAWTALAYIGPPAGSIQAYGGSTAPDGWLACNGAAVSRSTYSVLFTNIGTTWGVGDGSTTFNLPDLRGVFLRGAGNHGTLTKAGGGAVAGGTVGDEANDKMQQITGQFDIRNRESAGNMFSGDTGAFTYTAEAGDVIATLDNGADTRAEERISFDSANSPDARTGDETAPFSAAVTYIIKT